MAMCLTPMDVRIPNTNKIIAVPCGKCVTCCLRKGSEWSFRLMQEEKHCNTAYFITLTYDNRSCPISDKKWMVLCKKDVQCFFKRLRANTGYEVFKKDGRSDCGRGNSVWSWYRKSQAAKPIRYYCVGEYGGKSFRPHYHAIVFNADIEMILKSWDKGNVHFGTVSEASVGYCMKYMLKKGQIPLHANDDRIPEFALMSKGLGKDYITEENMRWHHASLDRLYVNVRGGIKASMPRYYKERLVDSSWRNWAGRKQLERMEKQRYEIGNGYYEDKFPILEKIKYSFNDSGTREMLINKNQKL